MLGHSMEFRRPDNGPIVDSDRGTANVQEMETLKSWMDETEVFGKADDHVRFLVTIESLLMIIPTAEYIFITC